MFIYFRLTGTHPTMSESGDDAEAVNRFPKSAVERLLAIEPQITTFLDNLMLLKFRSEFEKLRYQIREFASREGYYRDVFLVLYLTISGNESFFDDAETVYDGDETGRLEELNAHYSDLSKDFGAVYAEENYGLFNPVNAYDWKFVQKEPTAVIRYRDVSGSLPVSVVQELPSDVLSHANTRINAVTDALEELNGEGITFAGEDVEHLRQRTEDLHDSLDDLVDEVDSMEVETSDEP